MSTQEDDGLHYARGLEDADDGYGMGPSGDESGASRTRARDSVSIGTGGTGRLFDCGDEANEKDDNVNDEKYTSY
jgi:hypothetical protein